MAPFSINLFAFLGYNLISVSKSTKPRLHINCLRYLPQLSYLFHIVLDDQTINTLLSCHDKHLCLNWNPFIVYMKIFRGLSWLIMTHIEMQK